MPSPHEIAEWITALSTLGTAIGVFFVWQQAQLLREQLKLLWAQTKDDHDRSRRTMACNCAMEWSKQLHHKGSLCRKLVETFTEEQARKLYAQESFSLPLDKKDLVLACLEAPLSTTITELHGQLHLSVEQVSHLRWQVVSYLNVLESVLIAARHGVADANIIKEEFSYLVNRQKGHFILRNYRVAAGGKQTYPAIEDFVQKLQSEATLEPGAPETGKVYPA